LPYARTQRRGRYIITADVAFAGEGYGKIAEAIADVEGR